MLLAIASLARQTFHDIVALLEFYIKARFLSVVELTLCLAEFENHMTCNMYLCGSKVESDWSYLKRSNRSLFVFVGIKGFYKVGNISSRHFTPVSVLKLLANEKLLKRFYCSFFFQVEHGPSRREMRLYEVRVRGE